jgi:hypothetical protein
MCLVIESIEKLALIVGLFYVGFVNLFGVVAGVRGQTVGSTQVGSI